MKGGTKILTAGEQGQLVEAAKVLAKCVTRIVGMARRKQRGGPANIVFDADTMASYSAKELRDILTGRTTIRLKGGDK